MLGLSLTNMCKILFMEWHFQFIFEEFCDRIDLHELFFPMYIMASLVIMHAWSKFTLYLWSFFSLKVHETYFPMLSYRNLITKSICQWFLSDMIFNFQTYVVIKYSSFNLFNYEKNLIFMFQFIWLSIYDCQVELFLVISLFHVLVDWFWNSKLITYLIFQIFGFKFVLT
jgi:hypothetical protein